MLPKLISLATLSVAFALLAPAAFAGVTDDGLTYEIADGAVTITGHIWTSQNAPEHLQIPSEIEGLPVRVIGAGAFQRAPIKTLHIPIGVEVIGYYAFDSAAIESLFIPGNVQRVGDFAFNACNALNDLTFEYGVQDIGNSAFSGTAIKSVIIPGSVTLIDKMAFYRCEQLENIEIQEGVKYIGESAFARTSLQALHIPASVLYLGLGLYYFSHPALTITVAPESLSFTTLDGVLYSKNLDTIIAVPPRSEGHFDIPFSVREIADEAFYECREITSISLPAGLQKIGTKAFYQCRKLTSVDLPEGVTKIEVATFYGCESLETAILRGPVTTIEVGAFYAASLTEISLPQTVIEIGADAFSHNRITSLVLPDSLVYVGDFAFFRCPINSITLPDGLVEVGGYAFYFHEAPVLNIPDNVTRIGEGAFTSSSLSELHVGTGIKQIRASTFFPNTTSPSGFDRNLYFYGRIPTFAEWTEGGHLGQKTNIYYIEGSGDWPETIAGNPTFTFAPEVLQVAVEEVLTVSFFARFASYQLEISTDASTWTPLEVIEGEGAQVHRTYTVAAQADPFFFRLVKL